MTLTRVPTFLGRLTSSGELVAFGEATRIEHAVITRTVVEVSVPGRGYELYRIARAGRPFSPYLDDEPYAYGYLTPAPATTDTEDHQ